MPARVVWSRLAIVLVALLSAGNAMAQWAPGGILVPDASAGGNPVLCSAGALGVWISWSDARTYATTRDDIYAQHLTWSGALAANAYPSGIPVCAAPEYQGDQTLAADGNGGAYFVWTDWRQIGPYYSARLQHLDAVGQIVAGWPADGLMLTPTPTVRGTPGIAPDGQGGLFLAWSDIRNDNQADLYLQRLTSAGTPAAGWPAGGLAFAAGPGPQGGPPPMPDGSGGALIVWADGRPGAPGLYVEHILGDGTPAPEAVAGGTRVPLSQRGWASLCADGSGGCYLALSTGSYQYSGLDSTYYVLRVNSAGAVVPGWTPNGTLVCAADFVRTAPHIAADAAGDVFMAWQDSRGHGYSDIYAIALLPDGTRAPGWQVNGTRVSTFPYYQQPFDLIADGQGGIFVTGAYSTAVDWGFIQHLQADGQPAAGWNTDGRLLNALPDQTGARMVSDGAGGAFVAWNNPYAGVYANHYDGGFATATTLALVSADAQPDRVTLLWQGDAAGQVAATVERRTASDGWQTLGAPVRDGSDRLRFEDRGVGAGTRYAYRLRYGANGTAQTSAESWVDVPAAARLALTGLTPNPASSSNLRVAFSLPDAGAARLELIDVSGRRIAAREVGALGAGTHVEALQPETHVPAGLYWLRLTAGHRTLIARAVIAG